MSFKESLGSVLNCCLFSTLAEVKEHTEDWIKEYNEELPHEPLGDLTPAEFLEANSPSKISTFRGGAIRGREPIKTMSLRPESLYSISS